jgi:hypothetical protein
MKKVDEAGNVVDEVVLADGIYDFRTDAVTVTATAVELKAGTSALAGRKQMIVYPPTVGTVYWGTSSVTSATGAPLAAGDDPLEFNFANDDVKVYAVSDGTDRSVRVVESK